MKIYFKDANTEDLKSLILSLYPVIGNSRQYAKRTYRNPELTEIECTGKRRSFEDLLSISKTYFPDTTEEDLMKVLIDIEIKWYFCSQIKKIVFHYNGNFFADEFNTKITYYNFPYVANTYTIEMLSNIVNKIK